jgi:hypothetical protein
MAEVFLSYSQKDRTAVERIAAALSSLGLSVWYDARLDSGSSFDETINANLREAKAVLVLWSPSSIGSRWPRAEAMLAYDKHKLVAAFLAPCELTLPFNLVQTGNLSDWSGDPSHAGWRSVVRGVANLCERPGVGMLAEAQVTGAPESIARWAKQFPDEPLAKEMWESRSAHLRFEFAADLQKARVELSSFLDKRRSDAEAVLARASDDFEAWLDAERIGKAAKRPSPSDMIGPLLSEGRDSDRSSRSEIERLKVDLARANQRAEAATKELERTAVGSPAQRDEMAQDRGHEIPRKGPPERYVMISLLTLGAVNLGVISLFALLYLLYDLKNIDGLAAIVTSVTIMLDAATIFTVVAVRGKWQFAVNFGLAICSIGTVSDGLSAIIFVFVSDMWRTYVMFKGDVTQITIAYIFLFRAIALAAHVPGLVYFWRLGDGARKT